MSDAVDISDINGVESLSFALASTKDISGAQLADQSFPAGVVQLLTEPILTIIVPLLSNYSSQVCYDLWSGWTSVYVTEHLKTTV